MEHARGATFKNPLIPPRVERTQRWGVNEKKNCGPSFLKKFPFFRIKATELKELKGNPLPKLFGKNPCFWVLAWFPPFLIFLPQTIKIFFINFFPKNIPPFFFKVRGGFIFLKEKVFFPLMLNGGLTFLVGLPVGLILSQT